MTFIILVLVAVFYGLCIGGVIVEIRYVAEDFSDIHVGSFDGYDLILLLLIILFAPVCCIAGGVVCAYKTIRESTEG